MSYVRALQGVPVPAGEIDWCDNVEATIPALVSGWKQLKAKMAALSVKEGSQQHKDLLVLASEMDDWRVRYTDYTSVMDWSSWAPGPAPSFFSQGQCKAIQQLLSSLADQLSEYGDRFSQLTGQPKPEGTTKKKTFVEPKTALPDPFSWLKSMAIIGVVGIAVYFGGRYLLGRQQIPKKKLPEYAGGSRKK